ncbi:ABC transporter permease [Levilactobacillus parabrevis]|uniref:Multidrug ABC superfamily ATP binding cassette transporter, permease protein n=1 Tax=Levilactobacillus parabrevis ATCC 53295 TaxID=1267003 RepID=A0A0R1GVK8_9LACO|nr:ABC transporter permease [Levilactobacillus parabrevis]KRK38284.1 multidrug ABC superfamily ATP binding cassette transporter, permease protein [Levilactobacillus parabrevis ATCC 53295]KRO06494.1 multidrug ABC superfamily ATP binding cassette transporter, permease protein [Levilactobacillus parabrevis]
MRVIAIFKRVLREMIRDKRTLALMFLAPLFILTLMYFLFNTSSDTVAKIGVSRVDTTVVKAIKNKHVKITHYNANATAKDKVREDNLAAFIKQRDGKLTVTYQNSQPSDSALVRQALQGGLTKIKVQALAAATQAQKKALQQQAKVLKTLVAQQQKMAVAQGAKAGTMPIQSQQTKLKAPTTYSITSHYLYGSSDSTFFDTFLPILLGFFVFFFVFLISGISLLNERTTGTLTRLLATPIRRGEIITGYLMGYGLFALVQTVITVTFALTVFQIHMIGSVWLILLINFLLALVALSMGIFVSTFANSEFQMMQFIPILVIPQVFFSGLIPVDQMANWLQWIAHIFPLYYGGNALMNVATRGVGFAGIAVELGILVLFAVLFTVLNVVGMKRYRRV